MSISFGNTGIKPYVGNKEVKEAYVGSQLVYRAIPPYYYFFLGTPNNYIINRTELLENAEVTNAGYENYVIKMTTKKSGGLAFGASIRLTVTGYARKVLYLKAYAAADRVTCSQRKDTNSYLEQKNLNIGGSPSITEITIRPDANYIDIGVPYSRAGQFCIIEAMWVDQE